MAACCCSLAGTAACYTCLNNPTFAYSPVKYVRVERVTDLIDRVDDYFSPPKTNTPKPKSNADRIRAMTDEELAEFIGDDAMHDICPNNCHDDLDRPCKVCALEWLKQEVNTDG